VRRLAVGALEDHRAQQRLERLGAAAQVLLDVARWMIDATRSSAVVEARSSRRAVSAAAVPSPRRAWMSVSFSSVTRSSARQRQRRLEVVARARQVAEVIGEDRRQVVVGVEQRLGELEMRTTSLYVSAASPHCWLRL
jgi:hypothetical protein